MKLVRSVLFVILFSLIIIIVEGSTGIIRKYDVQLDIIIMFVKYFILSSIVFKYLKSYANIYIAVFLVLWCLLFSYPFINIKDYSVAKYSDLFFGLPNMISGLLGAIASYIILYRDKKVGGLLMGGISLCLLIAFYFKNDFYYDYIFYTYIENKKTINEQNEIYYLLDNNNDTVLINNDKYTVLDFWHSRCSSCFKDFPKFDELYSSYKDSDVLDFYSIRQPIDDEYNDVIEQMKNYSFVTLSGSQNISNVFDVRAYPTLLIIKNNQIIHRGSIKTATDFLKKNIL